MLPTQLFTNTLYIIYVDLHILTLVLKINEVTPPPTPPSHNEGDDSLVSVGDQAVVWDVYLGF